MGASSGITTILGRSTIQSVLLRIACVLCVFTYILYLLDDEIWNTTRTGISHTWDIVTFPFGANTTITLGGNATTAGEANGREDRHYCSAEEYATGEWVRRLQPPSSLEDIRKLYSVTVSLHLSAIHFCKNSINPCRLTILFRM